MNVPDSKLNFAFTRINVSLSLGHFKTKIQIKLEFGLNIASGQKKKVRAKNIHWTFIHSRLIRILIIKSTKDNNTFILVNAKSEFKSGTLIR